MSHPVGFSRQGLPFSESQPIKYLACCLPVAVKLGSSKYYQLRDLTYLALEVSYIQIMHKSLEVKEHLSTTVVRVL